jgi:hypothetical protein
VRSAESPLHGGEGHGIDAPAHRAAGECMSIVMGLTSCDSQPALTFPRLAPPHSSGTPLLASEPAHIPTSVNVQPPRHALIGHGI